jgi:serine/threonine protein kinase
MLGNSNCNGDEFISEVSTIGRIHHINVVRLVVFCAEEMRRPLVYEYMPHGSLEKFIFSPERNFSRDKLSEIALGIARGINYLHQGCDMQILTLTSSHTTSFSISILSQKLLTLVLQSCTQGTRALYQQVPCEELLGT